MNRTSDDDNSDDERTMNGAGLLIGGLALAGMATAAYFISRAQKGKFEDDYSTTTIAQKQSGSNRSIETTAIARISNEDDLKCQVQRSIQKILKTSGKPKLIAEEWVAPYSHIGRGDLVYHFDRVDYVIELKWIDYHGLNDYTRVKSTVKNSNRKKKNHVREQALRYGRLWIDQKRRPYDVRVMAIVNTLNGHFQIILSERLIPNI
ncbi:hypothetical protein BC833DRAFT_602074 [Globomyces pollinis-pini]|nr:hypothetical protein BC833DRAFT_602074 [Globomyces pollinis-pini]